MVFICLSLCWGVVVVDLREEEPVAPLDVCPTERVIFCDHGRVSISRAGYLMVGLEVSISEEVGPAVVPFLDKSIICTYKVSRANSLLCTDDLGVIQLVNR